MNETTIDLDRYVDEVRKALADLPDDVREELTEDLGVDLAELVDERGADVLPAPEVYAAELRSAAGLAPGSGRVRERVFARAVTDSVDAAHAHWDRLLDALPAGGPRGFLTAVQPVWWVARAWVAWMVAQDLRQPSVELNGPWIAVLVVFVVASVQLGRRSWGVDRLLTASVAARLLLVALNIGAVAALPGAVDRAVWQIAEDRGASIWGEPWYELAAPPDATAP
ncbi:hypothetical protein GCM10023350_49120 [Nocardioides endophyticus]|uniref:DUF2637 domain-containing protein n=1 Tax=Nocardioides endophyticus TaxID=1353775 RepID=A0ABP8ZJ58_9ACTN